MSLIENFRRLKMENLLWNDFKLEEFYFEGRTSWIIYPHCEMNGKLMLKTEYISAFPNFEIEMLKKGYCLCGMSHYTRWAPDYETNIMAKFVKFVAEKLNLCEKCILIGMSCGGLQAVRFAELYPELAAVMYLDAPVLNILSMAGLGEAEFNPEFWRELVATYGFSKSTVINFRKSPIDNMKVLAENKIPVIMLYGNNDNVVIYEENGKVLEEFYRQNNLPIKVISKSMSGHHPHGLPKDPTPIIEFVERYI